MKKMHPKFLPHNGFESVRLVVENAIRNIMTYLLNLNFTLTLSLKLEGWRSKR